MSEQENYSAFFNPNVEVTEQKSSQSTEYSPKASKGKNNVYQSIIRFIPWYKNPTHGSIQEKWVSYLTDPVTNRGRYVDCPSSVGQKSILQDMYWKLKKSESVQEQKLADTFSRRHSYASLIQVIKDENAPELEGKILVYRYGVKIWEKINQELKPIVGEKHDPFHITDGKAFALVITIQNKFNNYDQSRFVDKRIPLCLTSEVDGKTVLTPINAQSNQQEVFDWVKENSPDLGEYAFKEWDQETHDYVNHVIAAVTGQGSVSQKYDNVVNRDQSGTSAPGAGITSQEISVENIDLGGSDDLGGGLELPDLDLGGDDGDSITGGIPGDLSDIIGTT